MVRCVINSFQNISTNVSTKKMFFALFITKQIFDDIQLPKTYMVMFLGWQAFKKNVYLIWPLAAGRQKRFESWLPDFLGSFGQFFVNSSNSKKGINLISFSNCRYFFSLQNKKKVYFNSCFFHCDISRFLHRKRDRF